MPPKKGKIGKKKAAAIMQRFARGWLVRYFYDRIIAECRFLKISSRDMVYQYKKHLREIMTRHHEDFSNIQINFREIYDYLVKKRRYEAAFDSLAEDGKLMTYDLIPGYFDSLGLKPSNAEIRFAAEALLGDKKAKHKSFEYGKQDVLDIAMHIYAPQGTHLTNTRISTWMCPVIDNDNALRYDLTGKDVKKIQLSKCIDVVSGAYKDYRFGETIVLSESQEMLQKIKDSMNPGKQPQQQGSSKVKGTKKKGTTTAGGKKKK